MQFLSNRKIIHIFGDDVVSFLQGLITNDMRLFEKQNSIYTCILTPNGRFMFDFFIYKISENDFYVDVSEKYCDELFKKLNFYKLRSRITIKKTELSVHHINIPSSETISYKDTRSENLGYRVISDTKSSPYINYKDLLIQSLVTDGDDLIQEKSLIYEYGFFRINAIAKNKGCYIGQELMARIHNEDDLRKYIYLFESDNDINTGDIINYNYNKVGFVASISSNNKTFLAIIEIEFKDIELNINNNIIKLIK